MMRVYKPLRLLLFDTTGGHPEMYKKKQSVGSTLQNR
jgi:hypothetical protein